MSNPSPPTLESLLAAGVDRMQTGQLTAAEEIFKRALEIAPSDSEVLHFLGYINHEAGNNEKAVEYLEKAVNCARPNEIHLNNLGQVYGALGKSADALKCFQRAVEINPAYAEGHNNLGVVLQSIGRLEDAERSYNQAIELTPAISFVYNNLGIVLKQTGRLEEAEDRFRHAIELEPGYTEAHNSLGNLLVDLERFEEAEQCYHRAIKSGPETGMTYSNLGDLLRESGRLEEGLVNYRKALDLDPTLINAHLGQSEILRRLVPKWHLPMMNDGPRNVGYFAALKSAINVDTYVLEIGTGSGLLAMMAARSGAHKVTTCEAVPIIAATARDIIAANGLATTINVIDKKSTDLEIGVDLADRADLLVSEIFSNELLGEGVLNSIEDAKRRLVKPDALIIPASGSIMVALFGGSDIKNSLEVYDVCGFDLSKFNAIVGRKLTLAKNGLDIELLTEDIDAFCFKFDKHDYFAKETKTLKVPIKTAGRCFGIVQWIRLRLNDTEVVENHPSSNAPMSHWMHCFYILEAPIDVEPGQVAVVSAMHDRNSPWFSLETLEQSPSLNR